MIRKFVAALFGAALVVTAAALPASAASRNDTACQHAGMRAVKDVGVFSSVAKSGVDAGTLKSLGVRGIDAVPDSQIFRLPQVLALHRSNPELFPWCD
jgi:hypothetical protein